MLNKQPTCQGLSCVLRKDMFKPKPPGPVNGTLFGDTVLADVPQHPTLGQGGPEQEETCTHMQTAWRRRGGDRELGGKVGHLLPRGLLREPLC